MGRTRETDIPFFRRVLPVVREALKRIQRKVIARRRREAKATAAAAAVGEGSERTRRMNVVGIRQNRQTNRLWDRASIAQRLEDLI